MVFAVDSNKHISGSCFVIWVIELYEDPIPLLKVTLCFAAAEELGAFQFLTICVRLPVRRLAAVTVTIYEVLDSCISFFSLIYSQNVGTGTDMKIDKIQIFQISKTR